jgi:Tol biopolymer transport system component/DNA-binding winged helix-turn-helix (wHTH) protein
MGNLPKDLYEFGPFRLDAANRLLLRNGETVPLKPKVFDTLLALVEQSGRVLTKQELMEKIWPDTAVEENNLTQNISALRKILGQSADGQQYIETIPRRGYRFVPHVNEVWEEEDHLVLEKHTRSRIVIEETQQEASQHQEETENLSKAAPEIAPARQSPVPSLKVPTRIMIEVAVVSAGICLLAAGWMLFSKTKGNAGSKFPSSLRMVQLYSWKTAPRQGTSRNGTFSRDGTMIVFSSKRDARNGIWVKHADGGDPVQIMQDEWDNESPLWSPNDKEIAFVSNRGDQPGIWSIPAFGGTPTLLKQLESGWPELRYWSKDSATLYYELNSNLFALDLNSKQAIQLTDFDPIKPIPPYFSISPKEDRIAYADEKDGQQDIWVVPAHGGEPIQIINDSAEDRQPVWHPDGDSIIYSSRRDGIYQLCLAYLDGSQPEQITFGDIDRFVSDISSDGTKVLYVTSKEESNIFSVNIATGEESGVTSDVALELWPDVSPDGRTIALQKTSHKERIYNSSIETNSREPEVQHLHLAENGLDPCWSPDGSKLGFLRRSGYFFEIWTVRATGGDEKKVTNGEVIFGGFTGLPYNRVQTRDFSWSPDGSKIAYCAMKSGRVNVWMTSADGQGKTMISSNTDPSLILWCPLWSPDGSKIAFTSNPSVPSVDGKIQKSVWIEEQGKCRIVFQSDSLLRLIGWSASGKSLLVGLVEGGTNHHPTTAQVDLIEIPADGGENRNIVSIPSVYHTNIQLSPDHLSIAFASRLDGKDSIRVIPANGGEVRKVTENTDPTTYFSNLTWTPDGKEIYYSKQASWTIISILDNLKRK